ncbi:hypothetical protein FV141_14225 (plasmid) [Dermacoccus abyssi]|uniref:Uncharacterized protein n=1 Tax=Dermacoccus abyssi TaxID=322596 RepID=A0ABX5ZDY0_9MICO|nr:hypothetical protein FV141_14225 [Dermacoccus abyssi]
MTTITRTLDGLHALRVTRDLLVDREAQRADVLAREMAETETTKRFVEVDDMRATINEDRAEDLNTPARPDQPVPGVWRRARAAVRGLLPRAHARRRSGVVRPRPRVIPVESTACDPRLSAPNTYIYSQ